MTTIMTYNHARANSTPVAVAVMPPLLLPPPLLLSTASLTATDAIATNKTISNNNAFFLLRRCP
jgi:hypothetical protein